MSKDVQEDEAASKIDPIGAFLTLRSLTQGDNGRTTLTKLGNMFGNLELDQWPYKDMIHRLQTVHEQNTTFCFGGNIKLNDQDSNLHLHVRDKRYIADLSHATMEAHCLNESRPWHDAGLISNLQVPILKSHCQDPDETSTRSLSSKSTEGFRLQFPGHTPPKRNSKECHICAARVVYELKNGDIPTFYPTLCEDIAREFTDGYCTILVPYKLVLVGQGQHIQKIREEKVEDRDLTLGFLMMALPTAQEGGSLRVHFGDTKEEFNFAEKSKESSTIQWVAFRSDCKYEVLPVTKGSCALLMYVVQKLPFKSQLCHICQSRKPTNITRIEKQGKGNIEQSVEKFCQDVRKYTKISTEKKLGIFLQNRYSMCNFGPEMLKGVDRLIYEEMSDLDVVLTPVICYVGCVVITNHLIGLQSTFAQDKCVYSFSMEDFKKLQTNREDVSEESKPVGEIPFIGFKFAAEVVLNYGETETEENLLFDQGMKIGWFFCCAMIVSAKKKEKSTEQPEQRKPRSGKKKSKRGGRSKSRNNKTKSVLQIAEFKKSDYEKNDEKKDEEGATALADTNRNEEDQETCSACGKHEIEVDDPLRRCSQCHRTRYCSRKCQRDHWMAGHKFSCGKYAMQLD